MASPQVENGYTRISNELLEALAKMRIPGEAMQVFLVILRKTYGYQKIADVIPLSQFYLATGIIKPSIVRAIKILESINIISKKAKDKGTEYSINKDYSQWKPLAKKLIVSNNANKSLAKTLHSKENTKENICDKSHFPSKKQKEKTNPQVRETIAYFISTLKDMHRIDPLPIEPSDAKLVKIALQKMDFKSVQNCIHWYISKGFLKDGSPDIEKYRLRLALSNFQLDEFKEKGAWQYG